MIPQLLLAAVQEHGHLAAPAQGRHLPEALRLPGQKHKVQPRMLQGLIAPGQIHQPVLLHLGLGHGPGHGGQQQAEIHGLQLGRAAACAVFQTAGLLGDGIPGRGQQGMLPVSPGIVSGGWVKQDHRGALQLLQLHIGLPEILQGDAPALHPLSRQQQCQQGQGFLVLFFHIITNNSYA